ncbi:MAG TPA: hypothetical protein VJS44_14055 [Pyrinomonadaceae bacterium]|nr:hypothetical protein [Pyrinomonadaceae bacterium]
MLIKMVIDNLTNAIKTARRKHVHVRQVDDEIYAVKCQNPKHPEPHYVRFEPREDGVYAVCDCPSTKAACYHLISAWNQREHVLEVQRAASSITTSSRMDAAPVMRPTAQTEKVRGIRI